MEENSLVEQIIPEGKRKKPLLLWGTLGGVVVFVLLLGGIVAYGKTYEDKVFPNVRIGQIQFGGMTKNEVKSFLDSMSDKLLSDGVRLQLQDDGKTLEFVIPTDVTGESDSLPSMILESEKEAERLVSLGKSRNPLVNGWKALPRMSAWNVTVENITVNTSKIEMDIGEKIAPYEIIPRNATLQVSSLSPFAYTVTPPNSGRVYDRDLIAQTLQENWATLRSPSISLQAKAVDPTVEIADVEAVAAFAPKYLEAPLHLTFTDPDTRLEKKWTLSPRILSTLVAVEKDASPRITLDLASTTEYLLDVVEHEIAVEPQNAKFSIDENGKVQEFQGARTGVGLDMEATLALMRESFAARYVSSTESSVAVVVKEVDPDIQTGEVNDLGIKEILGVGVSNFSGSPSNRIKNIRNAVNKLNGILIKPGEEFSAIKYTEPYTLEGGYLPEKVIKGDEIKPEIGGGLCQVGTTLFRMAMNSAMEITERRNHSLVVSYYNDPRNGSPGTDATIYDPAPDFRFKNDTPNYILIQTDMDVKTGDLRFTIWGTNDGRKGAYTKPVVLNWIPVGPARIVETTKLAPGKKECQHSYPGANTSFTYTRELPDGTKEDKVFESHYRALPEICLVGVEAATPTSCAEGEVCGDEPVVSENTDVLGLPVETPAPVLPIPEG